MSVKKVYLLMALVMLGGLWSTSVQAQYKRRIIQLSGVTIGKDSTEGPIPGVHVYVPKAGRGTSSNPTGFFSLPVLVGDSVVISAVGYQRQSFIVPDSPSDFLTYVVEMVHDNTLLEQVTILPFPTEEVFKQAVLALNVPMDDGIDRRNLNAELMALMMRTTPMDGNLNYRYYMDQYNTSLADKSVVRTNPFLNPFNWARFFRDLKANKKK